MHVLGAIPQGGSPFPPIAAYVFLSDCAVCALVAPDSDVDWMCVPRPDGPSIFGAMLDRDAAGFKLAPARTMCRPGGATCRARWGYRVEETDDGLVGAEGAFFTSSFWAVSALVEIGESDRARKPCEKVLCAAATLELCAEELDPHSGRQLGNFPQGLTHLSLINAVMHVIRADEALAHGERVVAPAQAAAAS